MGPYGDTIQCAYLDDGSTGQINCGFNFYFEKSQYISELYH